ncbi:MAG TPA: hypothetical protein VMJ66_16540 [Geobacteraceae bacterium]|nr:hypothetical protein [Geobacteraceae bacterium]
MNTKAILRCLIVAEIAFVQVGVAIDIILEKTLPQELQQYIMRAKETGMTFTQLLGFGIGLLMLIGLVVGWIGLWQLWRPARLIYTLCWILGMSSYLLIEPVVYYTPLGAIFSDFAVLAAGMIIGLIYFSDLATHFVKGQAEPGRLT